MCALDESSATGKESFFSGDRIEIFNKIVSKPLWEIPTVFEFFAKFFDTVSSQLCFTMSNFHQTLVTFITSSVENGNFIQINWVLCLTIHLLICKIKIF